MYVLFVLLCLGAFLATPVDAKTACIKTLAAEKSDAVAAGWELAPKPLTAAQFNAAFALYNSTPGDTMAAGEATGALLATHRNSSMPAVLFFKGACAIANMLIAPSEMPKIFGEHL